MLYTGSFCKDEQDADEQVAWLRDCGRQEEAEYKISEAESEERAKVERSEREDWRSLSAALGGVRRIASMRTESDLRTRCWDERIDIGGLHSVGDAATAIAIHSKFYIVGTQRGRVLVTDFKGNHMHAFDDAHTAAVTDVSCAASGDPIATCSRDGTVAVLSLYSPTSRRVHTFPHPLRAISLCPQSGSQSNPNGAATASGGRRGRSGSRSGGGPLSYRFATGGKSDTLHLVAPLKGISGLLKTTFTEAKFKEYSIPVRSGVVHAVKWRGDLIAYGADDGVYVYDQQNREQVPVPDLGLAKRSDSEWRCAVTWETHEVLLVAWGGTVICLCIMPRPTREQRRPGQSSYDVAVLSRFDLPDTVICGVAPFSQKLVVLTVRYPQQAQRQADGMENSGYITPPAVRSRPQPELRVLGREKATMVEEVVYRMQLTGVENLFAMHYHLAHEDARCDDTVAQPDRAYIVLTPVEVVSVQPRDAEGHIRFLAATDRLNEAMHCLGLTEQASRSALEQEEKDHRSTECAAFRHRIFAE